MSAYSKLFAALLATVLTAIVAALTDGVVLTVEWVNVAIAGVGAAAVFTAPNVPGAAYTKSILAVLMATLTLIADLLVVGPLHTSEWLQVVIAGLGALGVYAVPNQARPAVVR